MPIVRLKSHADLYSRVFAGSPDIHALSGRPDPRATRFIAQRILEQIDLQPGTDCLVDIGPGDGTLLSLASPRVQRGLGVVPTAEECSRLRGDAKIRFVVGTAQRLPLPDSLASKVVCNAVLVLLRPEDVRAALGEMARIAAKGALVFVGEIPERPETPAYDHSSLMSLLASSVKRHGLRAVVAMMRDLLLGRQIILHPYDCYHAAPDEFITLAESCGLRVVRHCRHQTPDGQSSTRWDFLFRREAGQPSPGGAR